LALSDSASFHMSRNHPLSGWGHSVNASGATGSIREAKAREARPEAERDAWRAPWAGVDALLTRAQNAKTPAGAIKIHEENLKLTES
jgi:hypothetical protein